MAVAGFAVGQEMTSCPPPSVPMPKGARDCGIACKFPSSSKIVFGVVADQLSLAADESGKIESVLVSGIDAIQATALAINEYGAPDEAEVREKLSYWGWRRGEVRLVIFHHPGDRASSSVILDRYPQ
ncbi:hypothetical protein J7E49_11755 [Variovorax paradoxus]|nr:hypothetical protein [Variovorax paradoxus]